MLNGSCLCGGVRYAVEGLDLPIVHCHCRTCQKAHAAAFTSTAGVLREHFRWLAGEGQLGVFESTPGKVRRFCKACGTHLLSEWLSKPHIILRVATLDEDPGVVPQMHIWTEHDPTWLAYEGMPAHRQWSV